MRGCPQHGYTVLEPVLVGEELARVQAACMADEGGRNCHLRHSAVLELIDHPAILGHLVDAAGWNIQCRDALLGKQQPNEPRPDRLQRAWHFDYEEEWQGTTHDGLLPMLEFKVSSFPPKNGTLPPLTTTHCLSSVVCR